MLVEGLLIAAVVVGSHLLSRRPARFFQSPALLTPTAISSPRRSISNQAKPRMSVATTCCPV